VRVVEDDQVGRLDPWVAIEVHPVVHDSYGLRLVVVVQGGTRIIAAGEAVRRQPRKQLRLLHHLVGELARPG